MSHVVRCTHCQNQLHVKDDGGRFRCPVCGGVVDVATALMPKEVLDALTPLPTATIGADGGARTKSKCPACGGIMLAGTVVCSECGFDVSQGCIPRNGHRDIVFKVVAGLSTLVAVVVLVVVVKLAMQVAEQTRDPKKRVEPAPTEQAALLPLPSVPTDRPLVELGKIKVPGVDEVRAEDAPDAPDDPSNARTAAP
jgi:DNA-directed RNA polymerase subunit M/transcription elongation factor TFIIS